MIELKPGRYVSRVWFSQGGDRDLLGMIFRDPGGPWELFYRFRYYVTASPFDGRDTKSGYRATAPASWSEETAAEKFSHGLSMVAAVQGWSDLDCLVVQSEDPNAIIEKLKTKPWVHMKEEPPP